MQNEQKIALRTGIFVILALVGFIMMIFTVGSKRGYFQKKFTLKSNFSNVQGLWLGSSVRLAGVGVGKVISVNFPELLTKKIEIVMEIDNNVRNLIRKDSSASIKWLSFVTGDSYIELTIGSVEEPIVKDGDYLKSVEPIDFGTVFEDSMKLLNIVKNGLTNLESGAFFSSISKVTKLFSEGLDEIKTGHGLMHALLYEPSGKKMINNLSESTESLKKIISEIETGNGTAHQLIYGTEVMDLFLNFSKISTDIKEVVNNIKNSKGLLHAILYDDRQGKILSDMGTISSNLREFVEKINNGEGSLGAMINDPTIYESLKSLLGGAEQSFILKRLIRHSIKKGK